MNCKKIALYLLLLYSIPTQQLKAYENSISARSMFTIAGVGLLIGLTYHRQQVIRYLWYKVYHPNTQYGFYGNTALYKACGYYADTNIEEIKHLLADPRTDPNIQNNQGDTALHEAFNHDGSIKKVKLLLTHPKTNPNIQNKYGYTVLHKAVYHNNSNDVKILLALPQTDPTIRDEENNTPLDIAYDKGYDNNNFIKIINLLIVDPRTEQQTLPARLLHYACTNIRYSNSEASKLINFLFTNPRVNLNAQIDVSETALMSVAPDKRDIEIFERLLNDPRTDPNLHDKNNNTALMIAIANGNTQAIHLLLDNSRIKIDKNLYTKEKNNSLFLQACSAGIDVNTANRIFQTLEIDINYCDKENNTALHIACLKNNVDLIQFLLTKNYNPNLKNNNGNTPLALAATRDINVMNTLILHGGDISQKNNLNETILYLAYRYNIITDINQLMCKKTDNNNKHLLFNKELYDTCKITVIQCEQLEKFISWCIDNGADLNTRNTQLLRPVDKAEKIYRQVSRYLNRNSLDVIHKEKIYHTFLDRTPYCSDAELCWRLKAETNNNPDIVKKIMGYYTAVTIDRLDRAYDINKTTRDYYRKNLLAYQCKKFGYINPNQPLQLTY